MSYTIEFRSDISSIVATLPQDFNVEQEYAAFSKKRYELLDQSPTPIYYISIATHAELTMNDIINSAHALTRGEYAIAKHKNFKAMLIITNDPAIALAGKNMNTDAFGNMRVEIFNSFEEAVAFIKTAPVK